MAWPLCASLCATLASLLLSCGCAWIWSFTSLVFALLASQWLGELDGLCIPHSKLLRFSPFQSMTNVYLLWYSSMNGACLIPWHPFALTSLLSEVPYVPAGLVGLLTLCWLCSLASPFAALMELFRVTFWWCWSCLVLLLYWVLMGFAPLGAFWVRLRPPPSLVVHKVHQRCMPGAALGASSRSWIKVPLFKVQVPHGCTYRVHSSKFRLLKVPFAGFTFKSSRVFFKV